MKNSQRIVGHNQWAQNAMDEKSMGSECNG